MCLKCIQRGMYLKCKIHAGYIRDPCRIHVSSEAITIHTRYIRDSCAEYMRNTCGIYAGYAYLGCQGECIDVIIMCSAPIRPPIASLCANGSSPTPSSCPIICFVMATLIPAGLPPWSREKRTAFSWSWCVSRCIPYVSHLYRECILCAMYLKCRIHCILNVSRMYPECILNVGYMSLGKIHIFYVKTKCQIQKQMYPDVSWCILMEYRLND